MTKVKFYPLGNADSCLIQTGAGKYFLFDYADMRNPDDIDDKRINLAEKFKEDIDWPKRKEIDVLAFTHGDNDHVKKAAEMFWLDHAIKYQGDDRVKIKELWVPAALIVEEGSEDDTRVIRSEARYRFLQKSGIKVFARPGHLEKWLNDQGKSLSDYKHLIVDAGQCVPGLTLEGDGIEFFVHSPFAKRTDEGLLDRNDNCLVMQATIREGGRDSRFLITADSVSESWVDIVNSTRKHSNDHRLAWDLFKIPHHCSYLSMADEKGDHKTKPTPEFEWLLNQGNERAIMVSSSWPIPDTTKDQPPHVETYRRYEETADKLDAQLVVTMEHPKINNPKTVNILVDGAGVTLKHEVPSAVGVITTTKSPRVG
ncbi:MAG: hypothetical protein LBH01_09350 [Verrucomicrobiales bacterium]|jgi:hypothetical protein|nr:hypothetical protein [Verrucomicrobiales bacterium]